MSLRLLIFQVWSYQWLIWLLWGLIGQMINNWQHHCYLYPSLEGLIISSQFSEMTTPLWVTPTGGSGYDYWCLVPTLLLTQGFTSSWASLPESGTQRPLDETGVLAERASESGSCFLCLELFPICHEGPYERALQEICSEFGDECASQLLCRTEGAECLEHNTRSFIEPQSCLENFLYPPTT